MDEYEVFFATNRSYERSRAKPVFGDRFHPDGPQFFRVGTARVRHRGGRPDDAFEMTGYDVEEETPRSGGKKEVPGSRRLFASLAERMKSDEVDVLVFIHGYANDFKNTMERAACLAHHWRIGLGDASRHAIPFAFSWPSDGSMTPFIAYQDDRQDAAFSGFAMARSLMKLVEFLHSNKSARCEQRIHLVSHSMGNWALRHMVLSLRAIFDRQRLPRVFDNVFLMAADEDNDAFETEFKLGLLPQLAHAVHLYYASGDLALSISDNTKGLPDRLGATGPRTMDGLDSKGIAIDCLGVCSTYKIQRAGHRYYRIREEIFRDVRQVLAGFSPDQVEGRITIQPGRRYRLKSI